MKNQLKYIILFSILIIKVNEIKAQNISITVGTDFPYQHFVGVDYRLSSFDISYRSGLLISPYSDLILNYLKVFDVDQIYIDLIDATYELGWMNSLGVYYRIGNQKKWYAGSEIRMDYLTAADAPLDILESITGESISAIPSQLSRLINMQLGLKLYAVGLRFGRSFALDENRKHFINTEFSASKHVSSQTILTLNDRSFNTLNQILDNLLWEDVFKKYGFVAGLGVSYSYRF